MSHSVQQPYEPATPGLPAEPSHPMRNGLGVTALVLGIIGTVSGLIPLLFWLAGILGLIALILGLSGRGRVKRGEANNKGVTTTGAVLGLAALILSVVGAVITFKAVGDAVDEIDKAVSGNSASKEPAGDRAGDDKAGDGKAADDAEAKADEALAAGDGALYDDDLQITVSEPAPYTPGEFATGHTKGNKSYVVTVTVDNGGKEKFDATLLSVDATAGENGVPAEQILDDKSGAGFSGTVLPGKKATVQYAFDAPADAKTLTVEVTPGFDYNASQWDLTL